MLLLQLTETDVDTDAKAPTTLIMSDRGQSLVITGQSVVGWRPGVTDWLTQKARRVGSAGKLC